jgi:hypothetical protein
MKNMIRIQLLCILLPLTVCCQPTKAKEEKYTSKQMDDFLGQITAHASTSISSYTEYKREATNEFYIVTRYPLSKEKLKEYKQNDGTLQNNADDISDFATYTFKNYELINEKNSALQIVDHGRGTYLQEMGLWEYDSILCQNLGIDIKLDQHFERLKGFITVEFEMPNNNRKEVKIPVDISIQDKVPE